MFDRSLTDESRLHVDRQPNYSERQFLRFCSFKYAKHYISKGVLLGQAFLRRN